MTLRGLGKKRVSRGKIKGKRNGCEGTGREAEKGGKMVGGEAGGIP